jgi:hypothetical protein
MPNRQIAQFATKWMEQAGWADFQRLYGLALHLTHLRKGLFALSHILNKITTDIFK